VPFTHGRDRRIRRRADFVRIQSLGERATTPHFVLLVAAQADRAAASRLGVVATKKIGNSVVRSRVKRLCRECFRLWPDLVPNGVDLVVIARQGAHELGLEGVKKEWERAHAKLLQRCSIVLEKAGAPAGAASSSAGKRDKVSRK
jgi:ribonuclease P protein component